ncbi:hypothetical protein HU200_041700 [Digitaria exilis]|uniref:BTB domain-containing protein n=1 Tax=Digitaria exilis TaxID=1010633 RepID=A0A835B747_9POAL|nr:hypothetical protein HU200_041700 [Digitaria exilis]
MAASQAPRRKTASRFEPETDRCTHVFDIAGYSLLKGLGAGKFIRSGTFLAGGREWCIRYKPDGDSRKEYQDYVGVSLELMGKSGKRADVTFKVKNANFRAHKFVLAMRSPVFEAELYGPMKGTRKRSITVEDMEPEVFELLLHFMYTDSLPPMDNLDEVESQDIVKHLLVAADRIDVDSVAPTLALAEQHHCNKLKDACIGFMNSSDRIDLVASKGYEHLKRAYPGIFMDLWEKAAKSRKK